jgi:hypothetical protein
MFFQPAIGGKSRTVSRYILGRDFQIFKQLPYQSGLANLPRTGYYLDEVSLFFHP